MRNKLIAAALASVVMTGAAGILRGEIPAVGGNAPAANVDPNDPVIQKMVQAEVQRQLPAAVQREVQRQLGEIMKQMQVRAAAEARPRSLASSLQTLRSELELYKIQHNDQFPSMAQLTGWNALLRKTDGAGASGKEMPFGPYLRAAPVNPYTGKSAVVPAGAATTEAGWTWDEAKGKLLAVLPRAAAMEVGSMASEAEFLK